MIKGGISADVCINDLEPPAHMVLPKLKDIKKALGQSGFTTVLLSGSGATTFAHRCACRSLLVDFHSRLSLPLSGMAPFSHTLAGRSM